jgi:hypothetical protein
LSIAISWSVPIQIAGADCGVQETTVPAATGAVVEFVSVIDEVVRLTIGFALGMFVPEQTMPTMDLYVYGIGMVTPATLCAVVVVI